MLKNKYVPPLLLLIATIIIIILFFIPVYTLDLRPFSDEEIIFKQKVQPGDKFTLKYTHSVALTPVWEIFIIDKDYQIILIETDFLDHGAGLPYTTFENEIFVEEEGRFKIKNMHRIMPTPIYYRIGAVSENIFNFKNIKIDLSSSVGDKLLTIGVYKRNLYNYYCGGKL
ncbi:hypothetical protein A2V47_00160 [Candidatus Atribacteria bacterium RBG_19FT_COMBO_35_14]|uniref:DUF1850 domain-containing protein n=1 Tax=Candidatus Sediminicultor quintus TaxID=1797291 RepID=A0A1F5ABE8_9BACT|nr:MAG: hypothetical protein A2V47_00160 [Candidatus Atribacteria bacterium RBG_19FT_COMBO_35_14]OGD36523.1 MAG: hypothetical protein A2V94_02945 [Candidatus Atribacteria bacterium RBG_16_35_8]